MKLKTKINNIFALALMSLSIPALAESDLRVRLAFRMPIDPINTKTMADYDLSLILGRTLFDYDASRNAKPGIIKQWNFNIETGEYLFEIDEKAKWSDGSSITAEHIAFNLRRPSLIKSTFGETLAELVKLDSIKIKSNNKLSIETIDKKPQKSLFQRLGSVFFTLVHPKDTKDNKIISNAISCGPYVLTKLSEDELVFEPNKFFQSSNKNSPSKIIIKKPNPSFAFEDFINKKTWENLIQTSTLMTEDKAEILIKSNLPTWTRGHDRVALIKPTSGKNILSTRKLIQYINNKKNDLKNKKLPLNIQVAESLQPNGYPLYEKLNQSKIIDNELKNKTFKIVTNKTVSTDFLKSIISEITLPLKISVIWSVLETNEFINEMNNSSKHDLALFSFGVADPESATWMSLIIKNQFIEVEDKDKDLFKKIIKNSNILKETLEFKHLLKLMFERGSYAPLFHFSTLSIGHDNLDLSNISALDETVDYSKIIFKK